MTLLYYEVSLILASHDSVNHHLQTDGVIHTLKVGSAIEHEEQRKTKHVLHSHIGVHIECFLKAQIRWRGTTFQFLT